MLKHLPLGLLTGLKVLELDNKKAVVSVPFKYLNKNPFRSVYFAVLSMAAELSSGILALSVLHEINAPVSMLVLKMKADFLKKAKTKITFSCKDGDKITQAIDKCLESGEGEIIEVQTSGYDINGEKVADFWFTWTFKKK
ncbi:MAG: thioesterase [Bacteroidetes bacterium]|nr:MAG: thioesterase [Bacteroidota bacterium]